LSLKPSFRGANLFLGIAEYRNNNYPDAIAAIKRETATDPENAKAWMWLGVTQLAAGDADAENNSFGLMQITNFSNTGGGSYLLLPRTIQLQLKFEF
jgi:predicted Zn-dependent protease